jgi:ABC-type glycerol-3-phosphate transport system substrate-binding protein
LSAVTGSDTGDWFADTSNRDNIAIGAFVVSSVGAYLNGDIDYVIVYNDPKSADFWKMRYEMTKDLKR